MMGIVHDIERAARAAAARLREWVARPFGSAYRWGVPLVLLAALCLALPAGAGFALFAPFAVAFTWKAVSVSRRIHRLEFVKLVDEGGGAHLETEADRLQRAWVLGCVSVVGLAVALLAFRVAVALVPGAELAGSVALYLGFAAVLLGGFLLFYYAALRFDSGLARGLASIAVTLPAFFVIVALLSVLLSWGMRIVAALGLSAETMIADGFSWVYDVQRVLGSATNYFVQQDAVVIGGSIVFAALLLLLYAYTVPYYWMASVARWFKGLGLAAVVFSGAAIVFAGAWVVDVQRWAAESGGGQLASAIDADVLSSQAASLSGYRADDLVALVKAFVLPYTVGVFVANAVVAYRKAKAKRESDAILDGFAREGSVDEAVLPEREKRYLYFGGRRTLWDIALRSIGADVPLPSPFAPRKLTWKERLTGELEDR
ncbi:hypothetical protein H7313_07590 [Gordonibacter massiliensis]|uniref:Uncharacterized protein n=2 Tax=Gordonibacter massiliensis (ex Traore et al. 2017) TaxID=1841863 RepID=A0A842JH57_9ACTN|nr:hypothetical protein [Gordonibacter massiliensis (ex Traore et al. 2017)]